jgi:hypothetical protein
MDGGTDEMRYLEAVEYNETLDPSHILGRLTIAIMLIHEA